uniref:Uncharacterized protein n=1 Tax=Anguilla anguilla TaxID=7936 RepID=A0A0E9VJI1_ANGAN
MHVPLGCKTSSSRTRWVKAANRDGSRENCIDSRGARSPRGPTRIKS